MERYRSASQSLACRPGAPNGSTSGVERGKWGAYLHYLKVVREERYDAVFVLKRSLSSALLVWAARIPRRIGFATEGRRLLHTDPVLYRHDQHEVENFLDCLRALDVPIGSNHLELWNMPEQVTKARKLFSKAGWKEGDLKVIIHAAASLPAKQWPLERFANVMRAIRDRHGARFVYTGAKGDSHLYEAIERLGPFDGLNLCGITTVRENIAVYRACDLFFGVDSGPMHIASAVGTRTLALYGPISPQRSGPVGEGHRIVMHDELWCCPCNRFDCINPTFRLCMEMITVDEVMAAAAELLRETANRG